MITILHVITGLRQGGAEQALFHLVSGADRRRFRHVVATLRDGGVWREPLEQAGVEVVALHLNSVTDFPAAFLRLRALMRRVKPDIVQSWLYHADFLATAVKPFGPRTRLIWTLRNSDLSANARAAWKVLTSALAALSGVPDLVISNSKAGLAAHERLGYRPRQTLVIANGVDTERFRPPTEAARTAARARLGLSARDLVIGMAARFDAAKDYPTFFEAFRAAKARGLAARYVLAGDKVSRDNLEFQRLLRENGAGEDVILLGPQTEMPNFYAALDLFTLTSSRGEGFPNVIAEAMACGLPVAATDTGDERDIVGDCGFVTPAGGANALAESWLKLTSALDRKSMGFRARDRIVELYPVQRMSSAFEKAYEGLRA